MQNLKMESEVLFTIRNHWQNMIRLVEFKYEIMFFLYVLFARKTNNESISSLKEDLRKLQRDEKDYSRQKFADRLLIYIESLKNDYEKKEFMLAVLEGLKKTNVTYVKEQLSEFEKDLKSCHVEKTIKENQEYDEINVAIADNLEDLLNQIKIEENFRWLFHQYHDQKDHKDKEEKSEDKETKRRDSFLTEQQEKEVGRIGNSEIIPRQKRENIFDCLFQQFECSANSGLSPVECIGFKSKKFLKLIEILKKIETARTPKETLKKFEEDLKKAFKLELHKCF